MLVCEEVSNMFKGFDYYPVKDRGELGCYYLGLFVCFGEDLLFLRQGTLANYIPFTTDSDPLLLKPARNIGRNYE